MAPEKQPIERYLQEQPQRPSLYVSTSHSTSSYTYSTKGQFSSPKSASSAGSSSRRSSTTEMSSAPSSATSISTNPPTFDRTEPPYWLQCTFIELGCKIQFYPQESVEWKSHCLSHLADRPPNDCLCIFCKKEFSGENCWSQRMSHIQQHLASGFIIEQHGRPDFAVIHHMYRNRMISTADYNAVIAYSGEIPGKDLGLKPKDYQPAKAEFREGVVCYDQRKEDRERKERKKKASQKGKAPTRHHRS